jgi:hypothetical protein
MGDQQGRAVGGSCLGAILGGILGVVVGGSVALASFEGMGTGTPLDLLDLLVAPVVLLLGAGIGGLIGAVGGATLGAGIATRGAKRQPAAPPGPQAPLHETSSPFASGQSREAQIARLKELEAELARLKELIAELEGKRTEDNQEAGE